MGKSRGVKVFFHFDTMDLYTHIDKCYHCFSMAESTMDRFIGKYCKIITKEPGETRAHVVIGTVKDVDNQDGFILIDSKRGTCYLSIETVLAIKPRVVH